MMQFLLVFIVPLIGFVFFGWTGFTICFYIMTEGFFSDVILILKTIFCLDFVDSDRKEASPISYGSQHRMKRVRFSSAKNAIIASIGLWAFMMYLCTMPAIWIIGSFYDLKVGISWRDFGLVILSLGGIKLLIWLIEFIKHQYSFKREMVVPLIRAQMSRIMSYGFMIFLAVFGWIVLFYDASTSDLTSRHGNIEVNKASDEMLRLLSVYFLANIFLYSIMAILAQIVPFEIKKILIKYIDKYVGKISIIIGLVCGFAAGGNLLQKIIIGLIAFIDIGIMRGILVQKFLKVPSTYDILPPGSYDQRKNGF
jgi:hypothetical protein